MEEHKHYCERCGRLIKPDTLVWLELNCATGQWAPSGSADWSGGPDSQGEFAFGADCAKRAKKHGFDDNWTGPDNT